MDDLIGVEVVGSVSSGKDIRFDLIEFRYYVGVLYYYSNWVFFRRIEYIKYFKIINFFCLLR